MKVVILAGEMGSRLSEETQVKPKPMVEIGPFRPLAHHEALFPLRDYVLHRSDILVDVGKNRIEYIGSSCKA